MNGIGSALPQLGTTSAAQIEQAAQGSPSSQPADSGGQPKFGDVWNKIQATMGEKPKEQREIKKHLDKDDFMKIMITQMKHQDPTEPFDANKLAQEIAQITAVEQLSNVNRALDKLSTQNRPLERLSSTNMIGKIVTVDRAKFPHKSNSPETLTYHLPERASEVRVTVVSDKGETVYEQTVTGAQAGENSLLWDGKKKNSLPAEEGSYYLRIAARSEHGSPIHTSTELRGQIIGVSFEGKEPTFLVGDAKSQIKVGMDSISTIESSASDSGAPGVAAAAPQLAAKPASKGSNFFTFEKGVGSKPIDMDQADPEVKAALERFTQISKEESSAAAKRPANPNAQTAVAEAPRLPKAQVAEEKGFPNGMNVYNQEKGGEGR